MKIKKVLIVILLLVINIFSTGCFLFEEDLNFTYDELSDGLLKIEYCKLTVLDEIQYNYDRNTLLVFNEEESEIILQNISNITFVVYYPGPDVLVEGKTLIFVYEEYELRMCDKLIKYNWFKEPIGNSVVYYPILPNEELQNLIAYIDLNFVNK